MLRLWSQFVPNMSTDIRGHEALLHPQLLSLPLPAPHITPSIAFRHLPLWGKDVVNQCLEFGITHHRSWLKCCFTSTETVGLLGTGAWDGVHLDFHTAPELWTHVTLAYSCGLSAARTPWHLPVMASSKPRRLSSTVSIGHHISPAEC